MTANVFSSADLIKCSQWLKIICEPNRLFLLEKIIEGVQCNCELGEALQIAPNLISHHLSVMREAGFIIAERDPVDSRWVYYTINTNMMEEIKTFFDEFLNIDRIQPRGVACGPQITEEQRQSLLRMTGR